MKREAVHYLVTQEELSNRKACKLAGIPRSSCQYRKQTKDNSELQAALTELTQQHAAIKYWQCCYRLWNKGYPCNHKRIYRVYTSMKLNSRRRAKKRLPDTGLNQLLAVPDAPNQTWSIDFMSDSPADGRKFRLLNIMDDFSRESLAVEVDTSLPCSRVIRVLERLMADSGKPLAIRTEIMVRSLSAINCKCGVRTMLLQCSLYSRASPCRTLIFKERTEASGVNCRMLTCFTVLQK